MIFAEPLYHKGLNHRNRLKIYTILYEIPTKDNVSKLLILGLSPYQNFICFKVKGRQKQYPAMLV